MLAILDDLNNEFDMIDWSVKDFFNQNSNVIVGQLQNFGNHKFFISLTSLS